LYGRPQHGRPPRATLQEETAARFLAVTLDTSPDPVLVDANRVRQHVHGLLDAGLKWLRVAELADVSPTTVKNLLFGDERRGVPPQKRIHVMTERRLLAVTADIGNFRDRAPVDGTITRRKLEALIAIGWDMRRLGDRLGFKRQAVWLMLTRPKLSAARVRLVRDLYEELWNTPPVVETVDDQICVTRSLNLAQAKGYRRPMDWLDIDDLGEQPLEIDPTYVDEVAVQRVLSGHAKPSTLTRAEKNAAARLMVAKGATPSSASNRLNMSYSAVQKAVAA
jgi:hypothetical protein